MAKDLLPLLRGVCAVFGKDITHLDALPNPLDKIRGTSFRGSAVLKSIAKAREARRKLLKEKQDQFEDEAKDEMAQARLPKARAKTKKTRRVVSIVSDPDTDSDAESDESTASEEVKSAEESPKP
jgi:hypothetical protein